MSTTPPGQASGSAPPPTARPERDPVSIPVLRHHAAKLANGLGPVPHHPSMAGSWHERRRVRAVFLAGLANWNDVQLRRAAMAVVEDVDGPAQELLIEAARYCAS